MRRPTARWWATARLVTVPLVLYVILAGIGLRQGTFVVDTATYGAVGVQAWRSAAQAGSIEPLWTLMGQGNAVPYFNKPPLALWVHGLALHLLGTEIWVSRLPTVLLGAATILALIGAVRAIGDRSTAFVAGVILATSGVFIGGTHAISLDIWLGACLTGAMWLAGRAGRDDRKGRLWLVGIPIGIALMVKPLVALVAFPILAGWLVADRRVAWLPSLTLAVLVALLISAPWHLGMVHLHGDPFTDQYLGRQIVDRAAGTLGNANDGAASPWYYLGVLADGYWPWLVLLPFAIVGGLRPVGRRLPRETLLPLIWAGVWLIVFSLHPDKRPRYIIPVYPAFAWLIAGWLTGPGPWRTVRRHPARALCRAEVWLVPIVAVAAVVAMVASIQVHSGRPEHWSRAIEWLGAHPDEPVWAGGLSMQQASRLYLATGEWPIPTRDLAGQQIETPQRGGAILYHHRAPWAPGPGEEIVLRTRGGDLVITRLIAEAWAPVPR